MDDKYVFLMSAYNKIEAENVAGILEIEGIKSDMRRGGREEFFNAHTSHESSTDIYVPEYAHEKARQVIEVEMARGDF